MIGIPGMDKPETKAAAHSPAARIPKVSIIMNCLDSAQYLREAIDSIYAQTMSDWEIIFWDNASRDESPIIAKSYDNRLRYFRNDRTVPLGQARNMAMKEARGAYVAFLDCDDRWYPTKLEKQIPLFEKNPAVGLVFSDALDYYQSDGTAITHFRNVRMRPPRGKLFAFLLTHLVIPMPTAVLRARALHEQSEWFEPAFQICTDYDLFLRIAHDWECDYVDEPLAVYRVHGSTMERLHKNIAKELSQTLDKLCRMYPDFEKSHANEIRQCRRMIAFQEAKSLWKNQEAPEARKIFKKYIYHPKFITGYLASYLPYGRVMGMVDALRKNARTSSVF